MTVTQNYPAYTSVSGDFAADVAATDVVTRLNGGAAGLRLQATTADRPDWRDAEIVNVREYRILGDSTDETAKIQSLFDAITASTQKRRRVIFPEPPSGEYVISAALKPPSGNVSIEGSVRAPAIIQQNTANTPILLWDNDGTGVPDIRLAHLTLHFATAPTTANDQQYAIQFRSNADGSEASGAGYYLLTFDDVRIRRAYVGIGTYATGAGSCPIWSTHLSNLWFQDTLHHAIKLTNDPGTGAAGQPAVLMTNINILNYDTTILAEDRAVKVAGMTEFLVNGLNIERWRDEVLDIRGGRTTIINGFRTERHAITKTTDPKLIYIANGTAVINGCDWQDIVVQHASGTARLVNAENAGIIVNGLQANRATTESTTMSSVVGVWCDGTATAQIGPYTDDSANNVKIYLPDSFATGKYGIVSVNGVPPNWANLPTASSSYRGRSAWVQGGAGVADVFYTCIKDATDAYAWKQVTLA